MATELTTGTNDRTTDRISLASKLARVAKHCGYIQKDKSNEFHKYRYASAAAILERVNEGLSQESIAVSVRTAIISDREVKNARGNTEQCVTVKVTLRLTDGFEEHETEGMGSGQDAGDKAIMKAQTAAIKYAWMLALSISTGDDPEEDAGTDEAMEGKGRGPKTPPKQLAAPEKSAVKQLPASTSGTQASTPASAAQAAPPATNALDPLVIAERMKQANTESLASSAGKMVQKYASHRAVVVGLYRLEWERRIKLCQDETAINRLLAVFGKVDQSVRDEINGSLTTVASQHRATLRKQTDQMTREPGEEG